MARKGKKQWTHTSLGHLFKNGPRSIIKVVGDLSVSYAIQVLRNQNLKLYRNFSAVWNAGLDGNVTFSKFLYNLRWEEKILI